MAAVTETAGTRRDIIAGNIRMVRAQITSVDNSDTWTPGLAIIEHVTFIPETAAATEQWACTFTSPANRQGVVTFVLESGTIEGSITAWGY